MSALQKLERPSEHPILAISGGFCSLLVHLTKDDKQSTSPSQPDLNAEILHGKGIATNGASYQIEFAPHGMFNVGVEAEALIRDRRAMASRLSLHRHPLLAGF